MKEIFHFVDPLREKIESLFPDKKLFLLVCGVAAGFLLLLLLLVVLLVTNNNREEKQQISRELHDIFPIQSTILEERFIPREPDFLPEVILDREPKTSWTDEDAERFWNDPLDGKTEVWKNRIVDTIDNLLENVP